ncbi:MAG: hypothetical protein PWR10_543 [Halanaerobiales bacterium]|nr:hypothetical protein [Halanaerobiales bacterium]
MYIKEEIKIDCLKAIKRRRSIRRYIDRDVTEELLKEVINAGRLAPSGGNMQPWEFIVVRERDKIKEVVETTFVGFDSKSGQKQSWLETASLLIVVCTDYKRTVARYGEMGRKIALMDTSAAIENMLLAATSLGLGSCWVSGFNQEELAKLLEIPGQIEPVAILPLGYFEGMTKSPSKFSLDEIIHYERYGNLK